MTQPADPAEVAAANLDGRLHPSQRPLLIGWWFWVRLGIAAVFLLLLIILPLTTGVLDTARRGSTLAAAPFVILLIVACVVSCVRSYQNLSRPLQVITGWTHNFEKDGLSHTYPICVRHYFARVSHWELVAGGKTYDISQAWFERLQPDRANTVVLIPRSKIVVNAFPA
ncbi:hypothetical protein [Amycolatopsis panacis]|uniref:Uncharacterized protein n=1 Tax=Amycolatopsis panacis TaxID=2340917 RepID=A0A419IBC8_9PSEU|nr:hypothetical protein [Amycolatopsis panacis]RJQ92033.1 hypothetical protein D5S19_01240 [Amycolatopsis panacis]